MEMVDEFLTKMYRTNPDFVFTVTRDFVRKCKTPVLVLPDDIPSHPYAVAMEAAMLAPKAEVSIFPWKEPKERIPLAVRQIRSFLRAHRPAVCLDGDVSRGAGFVFYSSHDLDQRLGLSECHGVDLESLRAKGVALCRVKA